MIVFNACGGDEDDTQPVTNPKEDNTSQGGSDSGGVPTVVEAVDLGLSVKWANVNIGANSMEDFGDYYAWGEISTKSTYSKDNYQYYHTGYTDKDGIKIDSLYYDILGNETTIVIKDKDYKTFDIANTEYDVAHKKWGDKWRLPTYNEMNELHEKCSWKWASVNDFYGYKITGTNGNFIFLPVAGYGTKDGKKDSNKIGNYITSTLVEKQNSPDGIENSYIYAIDFTSNEIYLGPHGRIWGFSVRPVCDF
jgi:hypothetical protein